jgi:hypothetical protein
LTLERIIHPRGTAMVFSAGSFVRLEKRPGSGLAGRSN